MASLRDQLLAIREEHGRLTPKIVVEAARPENHPLHLSFEWDDSAAAEKWREEQAGHMIRSIKITYRPDETTPAATVRAFHAVDSPQFGGHVYHPVEEVLDDPLLRQIVIRDMQRDWVQLKDRYDQFIEFWELIQTDLQQTGS